jgi:APA family basic amino acid/polyamine antiporter
MSAAPDAVPRHLTLPTAVAIVVANMVGTGVFTSLGFQVAAIPTGFPILLLWACGGLISFCGAVCYAELAAMMPRSGGEYHLLGQAYHPFAGFLSGWISVTVGFAAPVAIAGLAFGEYVAAVSGWEHPTLLASALVVSVTAVHLAGPRAAGGFQVAFTVGKLLLLLVLILAGLFLRGDSGMTLAWREGDAARILSPEFAMALFFVMYAYSGWNAAAYVAGDMRRPERNVPLALLLGTAVVTALYLGVNAVFLVTTPAAEMAGQEEVGFIAARHLFGESGGRFMGILIAFGLVSTVSSMTWTGPRVGMVMGEDHRLFRPLARRSGNGTPWIAILGQAAVVLALLWLVPFERILYYIEAILILSSMLAVAAVFVLRRRCPDAPRPYRAWGYPVTPLLFLAVSLYMLWVFVGRQPAEAAGGLLTLVAGAAVYAYGNRRRRNA